MNTVQPLVRHSVSAVLGPDLEIGGGWLSRPLKKGGWWSPKKFFFISSKNKGGPSPGSATGLSRKVSTACYRFKENDCKMQWPSEGGVCLIEWSIKRESRCEEMYSAVSEMVSQVWITDRTTSNHYWVGTATTVFHKILLQNEGIRV